MADPVVHDSRLDDGDDHGAADTSEPVDEVFAEEERRSERGSLYEPHGTTSDDGSPYGRLGRPVSRHTPFYRGFVGALGVLVALAFGYAVRQMSSVIVLVLIAVFLAVGLNPIVEFAIRRGMKRGWAVLGVSLMMLGFLTGLLYVVG